MYRLIYVCIMLFDVWPYACFVQAWVQWGDCKTVYTDGGFCILKKHFFLHLRGWNSLYIKVRKTTKGQKTNCIQLVLATQYMCVQLNKAKWFKLFQNCFFEKVILKNTGRYSRSLVLNLQVRTPAGNLSCIVPCVKKNYFYYSNAEMFVIVVSNSFFL